MTTKDKETAQGNDKKPAGKVAIACPVCGFSLLRKADHPVRTDPHLCPLCRDRR